MEHSERNDPVATRHATVQHAEGLHARPAEMIARQAMKYESSIVLANGDHRADAKSILEVLTLGAQHGVELRVEAAGPDAEEAVVALGELVESDFVVEMESQENGEQDKNQDKDE